MTPLPRHCISQQCCHAAMAYFPTWTRLSCVMRSRRVSDQPLCQAVGMTLGRGELGIPLLFGYLLNQELYSHTSCGSALWGHPGKRLKAGSLLHHVSIGWSWAVTSTCPCVHFPTVCWRPEDVIGTQTCPGESSLGVNQFSEPGIGGQSGLKQGRKQAKVFPTPPAVGQQTTVARGLRQNPELLPNGSPWPQECVTESALEK